MLSKKLAVAAASAALMLGAFAPMAFAEVNIQNAGGVVVTGENTAFSGDNHVTVEDEGSVNGSNVTTGNASASDVTGTELNNNTVSVSNNVNAGDETTEVNLHNCGMVMVSVDTTASSGDNQVRAEGSVDGSNVSTGNAAAGTNVQSLVNVNSVTVNGNSGFVE